MKIYNMPYIVIHHYWSHLRCDASENHAWQKGLESVAYVAQYIFYKVISEGAVKNQMNGQIPLIPAY